MTDDVSHDLLRAVTAELHLTNLFSVSHDMFGRGYLSLGQAEQRIVDQVVWTSINAVSQALTPEVLAGREDRQPVGFVALG